MSNSKEKPVSEALLKAISDAVQKETGIKPMVGTGHVKWPPLPDKPIVDKLTLIVEHDASNTRNIQNSKPGK